MIKYYEEETVGRSSSAACLCKFCVNNKQEQLQKKGKKGILKVIFDFDLGGEKIVTFLEALQTSGVGFLIVFLGLVCLIAVVYAMGAVCTRLLREEDEAQKKAAVSAPAAAPVAAAGEIPNRDELVAVLSAAVAEELGTDVSAIRVVSFKQIN